MSDEELRELGANVYESICAYFDEKGLHYERHDEKHLITLTVRGDDIPMDMIMAVRDDRRVVQLVSPMPYNIPEDKRIDLALATTKVNDRLLNGSFDFSLENGKIAFRLTQSYIDSILGKGLFEYMLVVASNTVDEYNDKFLMISKGVLSIENFFEQMN